MCRQRFLTEQQVLELPLGAGQATQIFVGTVNITLHSNNPLTDSATGLPYPNTTVYEVAHRTPSQHPRLLPRTNSQALCCTVELLQGDALRRAKLHGYAAGLRRTRCDVDCGGPVDHDRGCR